MQTANSHANKYQQKDVKYQTEWRVETGNTNTHEPLVFSSTHCQKEKKLKIAKFGWTGSPMSCLQIQACSPKTIKISTKRDQINQQNPCEATEARETSLYSST